MLIRKPADIKSSEITPKELYLNRRQFITSAAAAAVTAGAALAGLEVLRPATQAHAGEKLANVKKSSYSIDEKQNSFKDITSYNNFYELGVDKGDPAENAKYLTTRPWTVAIEGEVKKPKTLDIDALMNLSPLEERVYRMRCVEAWSMVIPWVGFPLSALIKQVEPTNNAKFIQFVTLLDPKRMPGQKPGIFGNVLDWPYVEGLRMDEAMHPLAILSVGLYGEILPAQNGAPMLSCWLFIFSAVMPNAIERTLLDLSRPRCRLCRSILGPATCASSITRWSAAFCCRVVQLFGAPILVCDRVQRPALGVWKT